MGSRFQFRSRSGLRKLSKTRRGNTTRFQIKTSWGDRNMRTIIMRSLVFRETAGRRDTVYQSIFDMLSTHSNGRSEALVAIAQPIGLLKKICAGSEAAQWAHDGSSGRRGGLGHYHEKSPIPPESATVGTPTLFIGDRCR